MSYGAPPLLSVFLVHFAALALSRRSARWKHLDVDTTAATRPQLSARATNLRSSVIRDLLRIVDDPSVLSMAGGLPAPEAFPTGALTSAAAADFSDPGTWQYSPTDGNASLCEWIAQQSGTGRSAAEVVVTHGSQQALDLVVRALCDPGDLVAADCPGYLGALQVFEANGCRLLSVPVDDHGLQVDDLAERLAAGARPRLVYTCPTFQNPTGVTMPDERRRSLAALADHYGFAVVEDDPYSRLRWHGTPVPPISTYTDNGVWLSTFSKTLSPGMRLGWLVGPDWLVAAVTRLKQSADLHTSTVAQRLALRIVTDPGWYDSHLRRIVPLYAQRASTLAARLDEHLGQQVTFKQPSGGLFLWATLPGVDTDALLPVAVRHGVAFVPGSAFGAGSTTLRLSYATLGHDDLDDGARRLAAAIRLASRTATPRPG